MGPRRRLCAKVSVARIAESMKDVTTRIELSMQRRSVDGCVREMFFNVLGAFWRGNESKYGQAIRIVVYEEVQGSNHTIAGRQHGIVDKDRLSAVA